MIPTRLLASVLSLAFLAACVSDGVTTTTHSYRDSVYAPDWFNYAAGGRDMRVVIRGNPTSATQEEFERAVIAAMQGKNWGAQTNFTTRPSESMRRNYRVVMLFGGDRFAGSYALCANPGRVDLASSSGGVRLQAAFCVGTKPLTALQVATDGIASPYDARLERMVAAAVIELFPPIDETRSDKCGGRLGKCG